MSILSNIGRKQQQNGAVNGGYAPLALVGTAAPSNQSMPLKLLYCTPELMETDRD